MKYLEFNTHRGQISIPSDNIASISPVELPSTGYVPAEDKARGGNTSIAFKQAAEYGRKSVLVSHNYETVKNYLKDNGISFSICGG